jgi:hypothetical protein
MAVTWVAGVLALLGIAWALIQGLFTSVAASSARGDQLTQCGQDLNETMLVGLTVGVVVLALAAFVLAILHRPRPVIATVAAEGVLAFVWLTSNVAGGGVGCLIG